jgi:hypothetical protein
MSLRVGWDGLKVSPPGPPLLEIAIFFGKNVTSEGYFMGRFGIFTMLTPSPHLNFSITSTIPPRFSARFRYE